MKGLSRSAFFWFMLLLAAVEAAAFLASPYRDHPSAAEAFRNPTPLRGWPEYVSGKPSSDEKLVVLVGTSQGLGLEYADPNKLFVSRLRRRLAHSHPDVTLENWSVAGLHTDQLELLSLQAVKRRASLVVFLVSMGNLDEKWLFGLDLDAADVDLLAGDPALWPGLSGTAVYEHASYHDILLRGLLLNTYLGRSRVAALDAAAETVAVRRHPPVFGAVRPPDARLTISERLENPRRIQFNSLFSETLRQPAGYYEKQYRRARLPVFEAMYPGLRARLKQAGTDMLWAWTPLAAKGFEDTLLAGAKPVQQDICRRIEADDWRCVDKTRSLPLNHFVVGDLASHLNEKGHEALARILAPLVTDALH